MDKPVVKKNEGSPIARKSSARLAAVQVLYQSKLNNQDIKETAREYVNHRSGHDLDGDVFVPPDEDLLEEITNGVKDRWSDVDDILTSALSAGGKAAVEPLLEAILRAGCYEMLANTKTDTGIIINDYMNVASSFYDGGEAKLVNAILDKVAKTVRG